MPDPHLTSRGLLDTNVIIHLPAVTAAELPDQTAISAITLAELAAGPLATNDPRERAKRIERLQRVEAAYDPLPFDADAARHYASVYAAVAATGRAPRRRFADLLIACIAIANNVPLYTTNPKDFAGLEHLLEVHTVTRPT